MGRSKTPGLYLREGIWHIDKRIRGRRICQSTGTGVLEEAEAIVAKSIVDSRNAAIFGIRPDRTFRQAATKYLNEAEKKSLDRDAQSLRILDPYIGDLMLRQVHDGTLAAFIKGRRAIGIKTSTINRDLAIVRRILNLAARKWRDENGLTWLEAPPLIGLLKVTDARKPYPLNWDEQRLLFSELAPHLQRMAMFAVNAGLRDQDVCGLRWEWEVAVPEMDTSVFIIPGEFHKNGEDRLVVLNRVARSIIEGQRYRHREWVFPYQGRRLAEMLNSGWVHARRRAAARYEQELGKPCPEGFRTIRVHDLKHTFGRRLRAAGVSFEDRQDLLGHKSSRVTTHYSAAELTNLIEATEKVCGEKSRKSPALVILRSA